MTLSALASVSRSRMGATARAMRSAVCSPRLSGCTDTGRPWRPLVSSMPAPSSSQTPRHSFRLRWSAQITYTPTEGPSLSTSFMPGMSRNARAPSSTTTTSSEKRWSLTLSRSVTRSFSSSIRSVLVSGVLPIRQGTGASTFRCGSQRAQARCSPPDAVMRTRRSSSGARSVPSWISSQRSSASTGSGGPITPSTPISRRSTVTGTPRSAGSAKPGHGSPSNAIVAGSSATPTRSVRPSGESALRGHSPGPSWVAANVRSTSSGATTCRSHCSCTTCCRIRSTVSCLRWSNSRSFFLRCRPSTHWVAKNVIGVRIPKSRKYGLFNRMAIATAMGSGRSEERSATAILRGGVSFLGRVRRAPGTAGAGEKARSKSMCPSLLEVVRSRADGSGAQRSRSSPTWSTPSGRNTTGPRTGSSSTSVPLREPRSTTVASPVHDTSSRACRRETLWSCGRLMSVHSRPITWLPGLSQTTWPASGPANTRTAPAAASGRQGGTRSGSPTLIVTPGTSGLSATVASGSSLPLPT